MSVSEDVTQSAPRYVAVRLRKGSINLHAGIEDRVSGELIQVANASMAQRLAGWLNDQAEGRPLPARGPQHVPVRFQLAHDALPLPQTSALYVRGNNTRIVAFAPRDEVARHLQRLLAHVDYPMDEHGWLAPPKAHNYGDRLDALADQTLELPKRESRPYWKRTIGVALWLWIPNDCARRPVRLRPELACRRRFRVDMDRRHGSTPARTPAVVSRTTSHTLIGGSPESRLSEA